MVCDSCGGGAPGRCPAVSSARLECRTCRRAPVRTIPDIQVYKEAVQDHMTAIGLALPAPTRILLAREGQVFGPPRPDGTQRRGDTTWSYRGRRRTGPVTIRIAGGLPGHVFQRTLAHEYGHAAIAGGTQMASLPLILLEGFAECVAVRHLSAMASSLARRQVRQIERNPDPVYGGGFRLVQRSVESYGLVAVARALHEGRPGRVGLGGIEAGSVGRRRRESS